jgi:tRNA-2-methylthio-N6-dimethylallyladenosine synthase
LRPDIAVSGDFIVGFPGETDAEFQDTLKVTQAVGYASAYSFKYSMRPGTPAAERENQVEDKVKATRLAQLQGLIQQQTAAFNAACVGRTLPVLLEKPGRRPGQLIGRSPYLQSVHLSAAGLKIGDIAPIFIKSVGPNSLSGQYVAVV